MNEEEYRPDDAVEAAEEILQDEDEKSIQVPFARGVALKVYGDLQAKMLSERVILGKDASKEEELAMLASNFAKVNELPPAKTKRFGFGNKTEPTIDIPLSFKDVNWLGKMWMRSLIPFGKPFTVSPHDSGEVIGAKTMLNLHAGKIIPDLEKDERIRASSLYIQVNNAFTQAGGRNNESLEAVFAQHLIRDVGAKEAVKLGVKLPPKLP